MYIRGYTLRYEPCIYAVTSMGSRDESGKFELKGDEPRVLRSIRLTDTCWDGLLEMSESKGCSRSDLLEDWVESGEFESGDVDSDDVRQELIETIREVRDSLEAGEEHLLEVRSKDLAAGRRVIDALIQYLETM